MLLQPFEYQELIIRSSKILSNQGHMIKIRDHPQIKNSILNVGSDV